MKYERMTIKRENGFATVRNTTLQGLIDRLAELEDKIERGELVERNEYLDRLMAAKDISGMTDKEIEFFAKHNAEVRKQAVKEFAERVKMAFYYEFDELIPSIMADKIDELVEEVCRE